VACCLALLSGAPAARAQDVQNAQDVQDVNAVLEDVGIAQRLGAQIPLDLEFRDSTGRAVRLDDLVGERPVILSLVYYECPMLCNLVLNGLLRALKALSFDAGKEFDVLTVSFDPLETPALAAAKKASYLEQYGREGAAGAWSFLTGDQPAIAKLTDAVGFRYHYNAVTDEYAHSSALVVLTPDGKISRYFFGVEYVGRDLRLALVEASAEKIGSVVDEVLLLCLRYDPVKGRYGLFIMGVMRLLGGATVFVLGGFIAYTLWKDRRRDALAGGSRPRAVSRETL
jgi:protein SCO1/2